MARDCYWVHCYCFLHLHVSVKHKESLSDDCDIEDLETKCQCASYFKSSKAALWKCRSWIRISMLKMEKAFKRNSCWVFYKHIFLSQNMCGFCLDCAFVKEFVFVMLQFQVWSCWPYEELVQGVKYICLWRSMLASKQGSLQSNEKKKGKNQSIWKI